MRPNPIPVQVALDWTSDQLRGVAPPGRWASQGGPVTAFLGASAWTPVARLTFGVYLTHVMVRAGPRRPSGRPANGIVATIAWSEPPAVRAAAGRPPALRLRRQALRLHRLPWHLPADRELLPGAARRARTLHASGEALHQPRYALPRPATQAQRPGARRRLSGRSMCSQFQLRAVS